MLVLAAATAEISVRFQSSRLPIVERIHVEASQHKPGQARLLDFR